MVQKLRSIVLIVVGIIAIGLSIKCYTTDKLDYESRSMYGGDAYTGIQNAAAMTSKNVKELAEIVQFGFGSVLLVMGLTLVGIGMTTPMGGQKENFNPVPAVAETTPVEEPAKETPVDVEVKTEA